jgi:23S rRNA pseudouridine1911/1915/1917 synthase
MPRQWITVTEELVGKRTDKLVADHFPAYPRTALHTLFESGNVQLNGKETKPGIKVRLGDSVRVDLSPLEITIADIELPILYEDNDVLVVDKPSGVISHARGRYFDEPSVASFVRQKVAGLTGERSGIVHRLDRATSGVMICAKNSTALSRLQKQFSERQVQKTYMAVVVGEMPSDKGIIDMPIARNPAKPITFHVDSTGKNATTHYTVIAQHERYSLLELKPVTGRTHQLRVHLSQLKHPIVGDELYGGEPAERLMLHAYSLTISVAHNAMKTFIAPLPPVFRHYVPEV